MVMSPEASHKGYSLFLLLKFCGDKYLCSFQSPRQISKSVKFQTESGRIKNDKFFQCMPSIFFFHLSILHVKSGCKLYRHSQLLTRVRLPVTKQCNYFSLLSHTVTKTLSYSSNFRTVVLKILLVTNYTISNWY